jgi:uncharacterized membrane protein HdeD (DUF308 family)
VRTTDSSGLSKEQVQWRRGLGVAYMLLGVLWLVSSAIGTIDYVHLALGLLWILSGVGWLWGIRVWRRRAERSMHEADTRHHEVEDPNL